jgi:DNA-binding transcriptional ArsR family regulator
MSEEEITDSLKSADDIEFYEKGKRQRELIFVTDDSTMQALDDPVRLAIVTVLRKGVADTLTTERIDEKTGDKIIRQREVQRHVLSVVEIVKMSQEHEDIEEITKNQVYHHLPKLEEAGLVVKYCTAKTGKRTTDYYRRTAKGFVIASGYLTADKKAREKKLDLLIERLDKVFGVELTEDRAKEVERLIREEWEIEAKGRTHVANMIRGDVVDSDVLDLYGYLVDLWTFKNERLLEIKSRLQDIIFADTA